MGITFIGRFMNQREQKSIPQKFKELRKRTGLSMEKLAKEIGYRNSSSLQRYESEDSYTKSYIPMELAERLLKIVGMGSPAITKDEILSLTATEALKGIQSKNLELSGRLQDVSNRLGLKTNFKMDRTSFKLEKEPTEPFEMVIGSLNMEPRFFPGELIYVNPNLLAVPNDDVIVQLKNDDCFIYRLISWNSEKIVCRQYNPQKDISYKPREIKAVYKITRGS